MKVKGSRGRCPLQSHSCCWHRPGLALLLVSFLLPQCRHTPAVPPGTSSFAAGGDAGNAGSSVPLLLLVVEESTSLALKHRVSGPVVFAMDGDRARGLGYRTQGPLGHHPGKQNSAAGYGHGMEPSIPEKTGRQCFFIIETSDAREPPSNTKLSTYHVTTK